MSCEKRIAVVTGGSAGIGLSICEHLLKAGLRVLNLSRRSGPLSHPDLIHIKADLTDAAVLPDVVRQVAAHKPTTLVHNAGIAGAAMLEDVDPADLRRLTQIHLIVPIMLAQACLPAMREARFGRIVLISSRAIIGLAGHGNYSATKAALSGLTNTWALELGPSGITVNLIAPGPIKSDMFRAGVPEGSEREAGLIASLPVRRLGEPDDVARAVMYFADPANGYVTGQTLFVCGGASVGGLTTVVARKKS